MTDDRRQSRRRANDLLGAHQMSDEERTKFLEDVADKVAERAFEKFQREVGRSVIRNILWIIGLGAAGLVAVWKMRNGDMP